MRLENCKNTIQYAVIKYSDYSILEQDLNAETLLLSVCRAEDGHFGELLRNGGRIFKQCSLSWSQRCTLRHFGELLRILEIVFSDNLVCPEVKDGHFGE